MSAHDTAHSGHHHEEPRSKTSFTASFWFVVILIGLFIAALNFISVMGGHTGGHVNKEATSNQTLEGESGLGRPSEHSAAEQAGETSAATPADTAAHSDTTQQEAAHH